MAQNERQNETQNNAAIQSGLKSNKVFVIDTNVLLYDSESIFEFKGATVGIPFIVLEELDTFKRNTGENGRNCREVIRTLDELRSRGSLSEGVKLNHETNSILKVLPTPNLDIEKQPYGDLADNLILQTVQDLVDGGFEVTFVTKDINSRVKADSLNLEAADYKKDKVKTAEEFYKGWKAIQVPANELRQITINKLPEVLHQKGIEHLYPNEFIILESENNPQNNKLFRFIGGKSFIEVRNTRIMGHFEAKNIQQLMAIDLLRDDSVKIISLIGSAGTGKTFLTLLMGLHKVATEHLYRKFLITRPVIALGADIGYLPGEVKEKLKYWMQPVYDNLEFIFSQTNQKELEYLASTKDRRRKKRTYKDRGDAAEETMVDLLEEKGILSLEAITYMRGRSIPYQFVFIDEVQNLNPHEVKTIVSRAGEGTKIILAGDPFQIDSPYLDFSSNGLTVCTEKLKGQPMFATVFLEKSERSELAKMAANLL